MKGNVRHLAPDPRELAVSLMNPIEDRVRVHLVNKHPHYNHPVNFVEAVQRQHDLYLTELIRTISATGSSAIVQVQVEALLSSYERTLWDFARLIDTRANTDDTVSATPRGSWHNSLGYSAHVVRLAAMIGGRLLPYPSRWTRARVKQQNASEHRKSSKTVIEGDNLNLE